MITTCYEHWTSPHSLNWMQHSRPGKLTLGVKSRVESDLHAKKNPIRRLDPQNTTNAATRLYVSSYLSFFCQVFGDHSYGYFMEEALALKRPPALTRSPNAVKCLNRANIFYSILLKCAKVELLDRQGFSPTRLYQDFFIFQGSGPSYGHIYGHIWP